MKARTGVSRGLRIEWRPHCRRPPILSHAAGGGPHVTDCARIGGFQAFGKGCLGLGCGQTDRFHRSGYLYHPQCGESFGIGLKISSVVCHEYISSFVYVAICRLYVAPSVAPLCQFGRLNTFIVQILTGWQMRSRSSCYIRRHSRPNFSYLAFIKVDITNCISMIEIRQASYARHFNNWQFVPAKFCYTIHEYCSISRKNL